MEPFEFVQPATVQAAVHAGDQADALFLAGGTELLNWMRIGIAQPRRIDRKSVV